MIARSLHPALVRLAQNRVWEKALERAFVHRLCQGLATKSSLDVDLSPPVCCMVSFSGPDSLGRWIIINGGACAEVYTLITMHVGNPDYLRTCLAQAHFSNPNSRIVLLGDESNRDCPAYVEHFDSEDYFESAREFANIYRHFSPNPEWVELLCIQRWFVINEFVKRHDIQCFLHIDSDVLLYSDFQNEAEYFGLLGRFDCARTETSPGTSIFSRQEVLGEFCQFIMDVYRNDELLQGIAEAYSRADNFLSLMNYSGGSLQDMALFTSFCSQPHVMSVDLSATTGGSAFNLVIGYPRGGAFANTGCVINVVFSGKVPFGLEKVDGLLTRFHCLHFGGSYKVLMDAYATFDKDAGWTSPVLSSEGLETMYPGGVDIVSNTSTKALAKALLQRVISKARSMPRAAKR
ncbi:MAG: hypothetical protein WCJ13_11035 [Coriobacteriia bacterium]